MLCRYLKLPRPCPPELIDSCAGDACCGNLMGATKGFRGDMPLSRAKTKASLAHSFVLKQGVHLANMALLLMALPLGAQTFNAVQVASLSAEPNAVRSSSPALNGATQLQNEARNWLAQTLSLQPEQVQIAEMDGRLKFQPCSSGAKFDHPFANRQVIRARCESPNWQFFLKAQFSDEQATSKASQVNLPIATTQATTPKMTSSTSSVPLAPKTNASLPGTKIKTVLVANQPLKRGTILQASQFKQVEMPVAATDSMVLSQFKEIENTELLHDMGAEQAIRNYDIKPTLLVKKGQQVNFSIGEGKGFLITVKTEAQQDGAMGDQIKLKNVESGRLISGVITGLNEARAL
jgi:flagellar basal body P-ring formation protein FlgA